MIANLLVLVLATFGASSPMDGAVPSNTTNAAVRTPVEIHHVISVDTHSVADKDTHTVTVGAARKSCAHFPKLAALDTLRCVESRIGWVIAKTDKKASDIADGVDTTAARFQRYIGVPIPPIVVVYGPPSDDLDRLHSDTAILHTLLRSGASLVLSWQSYPMLPVGVGPHELGHNLFIVSLFKPWIDSLYKGLHPSDLTYGGPATDWLDEAAALLMEPPEMKAERRQELITRYHAHDVTPLDTLLTIVRKDENDDSITKWYADVQGVCDYLMARSHDSTIVGVIAKSDAKGIHMAEWLRADGARHGLPSTMTALEADWQLWLAQLK